MCALLLSTGHKLDQVAASQERLMHQIGQGGDFSSGGRERGGSFQAGSRGNMAAPPGPSAAQKAEQEAAERAAELKRQEEENKRRAAELAKKKAEAEARAR